MTAARNRSSHTALGWLGCAVLGGVALTGCGSNTPEIPDELVEAIKESGTSSSGDYPEGPYGNEVGDIVADVCFDAAWTNPKAANFDPAAYETVCFSDFYSPDDEDGGELMLVNTGAVWCAACQVEWGGTSEQPSLSERADERFDQGFRLLGTIFQDAERNPAGDTHAVAWAKSFDVTVPFALDPTFKMGVYADENIQPFNMVIDLRNMEILLQVEGDQPAVLFGFIDDELSKRQ